MQTSSSSYCTYLSFPRSHEDLTYEKFASSNDLFIIRRDCSGDLS